MICLMYVVNYLRDSDSEYIELLLQGIGMEKYVKLFESPNMNMELFLKLGNEDLKELGVTDDADRNCIMKCINELSVEPQSSDNESCDEIERYTVVTYYISLVQNKKILNHLYKF